VVTKKKSFNNLSLPPPKNIFLVLEIYFLVSVRTIFKNLRKFSEKYLGGKAIIFGGSKVRFLKLIEKIFRKSLVVVSGFLGVRTIF
jgi:hypothetical protein